ncbi:MAG: hypothetical protein KKE62_14865 [Proteobacteria bacterium]|nr:hypothetical protein [Pseudomonadota bacterium]MBU1389292.1 hypothetical protein [Pseudomonadota bacterium]MBU1544112.1 hypothetical protein [Pseudomonadota bacterium]MBU2481628.1 hypothetical protein [Pseudomonadota bacterium]
MENVTLVKTNDPARYKFYLKVTGPVEKIMEVTPASVYLEGKSGEILSSVIRITPSVKYPFSLLNIKKLNNTPIQAEIVQLTGENPSWQLHIKATSDEEKGFYEVLEIKTDSKYKPVIKIRVSAVFSASEKVKP